MSYEEQRKFWIRGYACAVATLIRMDGLVTSQARELYRSGIPSNLSQLSVRELVDDNDWGVIETNWKELYN